jgi:hypothetical protein
LQVVEVVEHIVPQTLQQVELVVEEDPPQERLDLLTLAEVDLPLIQVQALVVLVVPVLFSLLIQPNK